MYDWSSPPTTYRDTGEHSAVTTRTADGGSHVTTYQFWRCAECRLRACGIAGSHPGTCPTCASRRVSSVARTARARR